LIHNVDIKCDLVRLANSGEFSFYGHPNSFYHARSISAFIVRNVRKGTEYRDLHFSSVLVGRNHKSIHYTTILRTMTNLEMTLLNIGGSEKRLEFSRIVT